MKRYTPFFPFQLAFPKEHVSLDLLFRVLPLIPTYTHIARDTNSYNYLVKNDMYNIREDYWNAIQIKLHGNGKKGNNTESSIKGPILDWVLVFIFSLYKKILFSLPSEIMFLLVNELFDNYSALLVVATAVIGYYLYSFFLKPKSSIFSQCNIVIGNQL